jgi:ABC-type branched-subunit amino acid transport system substrate-binding protein
LQPGVRAVGTRAAQHRGAKRPVALIAALVAVAGCGLRVGSAQLHAAQQAATATGGVTPGNSTTPGGVTPATSTTPGGVTPGNSTTPGGVTPVTTSGGVTPGNNNSTAPSTGGSGQNLAPPLPAGGNGGATDIGVTATSIKVGNVSDIGGPVPGLFQGGPYGAEAYFDYINSLGGVYGRKLQLTAEDDQLECSTNEADNADLVGSVFAFVGGWSLDDNCGAQVLAAHPDVPIVNQPLSVQAAQLHGAYAIGPYAAGAGLGPFAYYKAKFPDAITKVGTIVGNQASAVQAWQYNKAAMQSLGYKIIYEDDFAPTQSDFTADVVKMQSAGVKMVYIIAVNAPDLAIFSQEAYQQGFKPEVFASGVGYFGAYISESGGAKAVEGQYVNVVQARFLGEDAASVPEVGLYDQWMKQEFPTFALDQFSATSWANAALFVQALLKVGPKVTRTAVITALSQTHNFNDNGMNAPADVGNRTPSPCYAVLQIHNGQYNRVDDPPTGYRCDSSFFHS